MSILNGYSLDGNYRPYWGEWDSQAVENLELLAQNLGCLEPRWFRSPNVASGLLPPLGYLPYVLSLVPGSWILGFMHKPQLFDNLAQLTVVDQTGAGYLFTAVTSGAAQNAITVNIPQPPALQALSISVVGTDITILLASDADGFIASTLSDVQTAMQASAPAAALVTTTIVGGSGSPVSPTTQGPLNLAGSSDLADVANFVNFSVQITDESLDHDFYSAPIRDDFINGQPTLFELPFPVAGSGNLTVQFWNNSPTQWVKAQLVFIVLEPVPQDLLHRSIT